MRTSFLFAALLGALASNASAGKVGTSLEGVRLGNFSQTGARSFDDLLGRAVLVEFFAYW